MLKTCGQTITYNDLCVIYPKKTFPPESKLKQTDLPDEIQLTDADLPTLKTAKQQTLSETFKTYVTTSFTTTSGYKMQFNESDSLKLEGYIKLLTASGQTEGYITDANDTTHDSIPLAEIQTIQLEMLAAFAKAHAKKQQLRAAIETAETKEQLNAINVTFKEETPNALP